MRLLEGIVGTLIMNSPDIIEVLTPAFYISIGILIGFMANPIKSFLLGF